MKQTIEFYYSLKFNELNICGDAYHFICNKEDYYFVFCPRTLEELEEIIHCVNELKVKNIFSHEIILNNKNEIITQIDDVNYILLKICNKNVLYNIFDIMELNKKTKLAYTKSKLYRNDWSSLWSVKIDYIETQLKEVKCSNIIQKSIDYYIGLAENAIAYVNLVNEKYGSSENDRIVLCHRRIYYPNKGINFCNPLSYIFDLEVRDVAEYIKCLFFYSDEDVLLELQSYLKSVKLTSYSYNMLFARLLYPSYYFDCYEKVVNRKGNVDCLIKIIAKVEEYQKFIKKAYKEITLYAPLEKVDWLIY